MYLSCCYLKLSHPCCSTTILSRDSIRVIIYIYIYKVHNNWLFGTIITFYYWNVYFPHCGYLKKKTNINVILYNTSKSLKVNKFNFFSVLAISLVSIEQYLFCIVYYLFEMYDNLVWVFTRVLRVQIASHAIQYCTNIQ